MSDMAKYRITFFFFLEKDKGGKCAHNDVICQTTAKKNTLNFKSEWEREREKETKCKNLNLIVYFFPPSSLPQNNNNQYHVT